MTKEEKLKKYQKEYQKEYQIKNRDKISKRIKITQNEWLSKNKNKVKNTKKEWYLKNKQRVLENNKKLSKEKYNTDPLFKLSTLIRGSICYIFKKNGYTKKSKTIEILDCSFDELKLYLESKFESWMNWDNYGNPKDGVYELNKTWDIDHIIPLSSANCETDIIKLNHYTNLQPLCSYTNRFIKKDKNPNK